MGMVVTRDNEDSTNYMEFSWYSMVIYSSLCNCLKDVLESGNWKLCMNVLTECCKRRE